MKRVLIAAALLMVLISGCPRQKPTKEQYCQMLADTSRSLVERQYIWQQMKKDYPEGCGVML